MTPQAAEALLSALLAPLSARRFFGELSGKVSHYLVSSKNGFRRGLLGPDPAAAVRNAYSHFRDNVKIVTPTDDNKSAPRAIFSSRETFDEAVTDTHAAGHSLMIHHAEGVGDKVTLLKRALENAVGGPVYVTLFWAPPGSKTKVHRDGLDILTVQVLGAKRWLISAEDLGFPNHWSEISPGWGGLRACTVKCPEEEPHHKIIMREGNLLYSPRGQWHEVQALAGESISLAFGFRQPTMRDLLNAIVDYASDRHRGMRAPIGRDDALIPWHGGRSPVALGLLEALTQIRRFCGSDRNLHDAMAWKRASFIGGLPELDVKPARLVTSPADRVRRTPLAICFVSSDGCSAVLSYPGDHLTAPLAFEPALRMIAQSEEFRVEDLPGQITDRSRLKIINKLMESGVLERCP